MKRTVKGIILGFFIFYCFILLDLLLIGDNRIIFAFGYDDLLTHIKRNTNLVPFRTINQYFAALNRGYLPGYVILENLLGNLVAFAPMGFFMPVLFERYTKATRFMAFMVIFIILVETAQILTGVGTFDVDDIILNVMGAMMIFGILKISFIQKCGKILYIM